MRSSRNYCKLFLKCSRQMTVGTPKEHTNKANWPAVELQQPGKAGSVSTGLSCPTAGVSAPPK